MFYYKMGPLIDQRSLSRQVLFPASKADLLANLLQIFIFFLCVCVNFSFRVCFILIHKLKANLFSVSC